MARGISDYANGNGYIYATKADGTTILAVLANDTKGARTARRMGAINAPIAANKAAIATITVTSVASTGNITDITILGVNQIGANIPVVGSSTIPVAAAIADAINLFTPASGYNYTATSQGNIVYIYAPIQAGSSINGQAVTIAVSSITIVTTTTAFVNGGDVGGEFDQSIGYRFFLDADYGAAGITGSSPATPTVLTYATEITKYLTVHGMEAGVDTRASTISTDKILGLSRRNAITYLSVDTEGGGASDNLKYIDGSTFLEGDLIVLRSTDAARTVTVKNSTGANENIYTFGAIDMVLAGNTNTIILYFSVDPTNGASFYEVCRTGDNTIKPTLTTLRANNLPFAKGGVNNVALTLGGGTINLTPGTDKGYQYLTGTGTLTGSWTIQGAGTPMDGDQFFVKYDGTFTAGANNITIFGNVLTADEIKMGGFMIYATYDSTTTSWLTQKFYPKSWAIVDTYESIVVPVSFESGEQCSNKIYVPYKFEISDMYGVVTKLVGAADNATITAAINGVNVTTGVISFNPDSALNTTTQVTPTANYAGTSAVNYITLTSAKTTAGGKAIVTLILKRKS